MRKTFYIIDGHAHIYRAYFAPFRDLKSPSGEPTKATYVFTQRILGLIEQRKPDYLAMVIDHGDETVFRKDIYPDYKANRKARPDDFSPQEDRILQIVRDAGIPIFEKPGFEADDLIATMATQLSAKDFDVYMVSSDKDLRQVVNDHSMMYDAYTDQVIDAAKIEEKCGFTPAEAIEVQTLTGDTIDNVPGIPGVGDKTAAKLIRKYGSADAVLQHLDDLTPKMREAFEKNAHVLPISRRLVTLKTDVDFSYDPEACKFTGINQPALRKHLLECGFHSLVARYTPDTQALAPARAKPSLKPAGDFGGLFDAPADQAAPQPQNSQKTQYTLVNTQAAFDAFLADLKKQPLFAFDTETDDLGAMNSNLVGMSFSWQPETGYYVPIKGPSDATFLPASVVLPAIKPILEDPGLKKVGHNIKYDLLVMRKAGIELRGVQTDSMIAAFLIDASRMQYGIDSLALQLLNFKKVATTELLGKGKMQLTMERVALDTITRYASEDADITLRLATLLRQRLADVPKLLSLNDEVEVPLIEVLAEMEFNGVAVDQDILKLQSKALGDKAQLLHARIIQEAGVNFNPDSPKQLADVLFNKLGLKVIKRNKTGPSTDVEVLDKLAFEHTVPKLILEYRSLVKLKNTYLDNLPNDINPATGRIHGSFNQTGAATGRLSMSDPNLQNIPIRTEEGNRIRLAFVPNDKENNVLLTADYSQIELRLLAHFTQEPALLAAFSLDEDIHKAVASEVFHVKLSEVTKEQRARAKTINFGIIYGISAYGLSRRIEGLSVKEAQDFINTYNDRFPAIKRFLEKCVMEAQTFGYVETLLGRRRPLPDISSGVIAMRNAAERMAINSVVQGSAADMIKIAMINVHKRMKRENWKSKLLLQVHDELVFECPKSVVEQEAAWVKEEMTKAMNLTVPLKVELAWGKNWQEGK